MPGFYWKTNSERFNDQPFFNLIKAEKIRWILGLVIVGLP